MHPPPPPKKKYKIKIKNKIKHVAKFLFLITIICNTVNNSVVIICVFCVHDWPHHYITYNLKERHVQEWASEERKLIFLNWQRRFGNLAHLLHILIILITYNSIEWTEQLFLKRRYRVRDYTVSQAGHEVSAW